VLYNLDLKVVTHPILGGLHYLDCMEAMAAQIFAYHNSAVGE
jgi:hypothetical protein